MNNYNIDKFTGKQCDDKDILRLLNNVLSADSVKEREEMYAQILRAQVKQAYTK